MDCAEEALILERRLPLARRCGGARHLVLLGQKMRVSYDAAVVSAAAIANVAETGWKAWLEHERPR